jgi:hypothetical protein
VSALRRSEAPAVCATFCRFAAASCRCDAGGHWVARGGGAITALLAAAGVDIANPICMLADDQGRVLRTVSSHDAAHCSNSEADLQTEAST